MQRGKNRAAVFDFLVWLLRWILVSTGMFLLASAGETCSSLAGHWCTPLSHRALTIDCFVFRAEGHEQVAACWKCCSTSGHRNLEIRAGLSRLKHDDLHWLIIPQRVQYKLAVTVHRCLRHRAPWYLAKYCVSGPKFLVASSCDLPDVINCCQFREFAAALLRALHFLSPDQQSGIHCLIICAIQLLIPNNLGGSWRRICSSDIRSLSAFEVLPNRAIQIDLYLLTYIIHSLELVAHVSSWSQSFFCTFFCPILQFTASGRRRQGDNT